MSVHGVTVSPSIVAETVRLPPDSMRPQTIGTHRSVTSGGATVPRDVNVPPTQSPIRPDVYPDPSAAAYPLNAPTLLALSIAPASNVDAPAAARTSVRIRTPESNPACAVPPDSFAFTRRCAPDCISDRNTISPPELRWSQVPAGTA